jgi:uncharacterized repeat protein (TIGR01451 family)
MFGNTLGWDCASGIPAPLGATSTVDCTGVDNTNDSAIDVFWSSDDPAPGQALASSAITLTNARSTAVLSLPEGARVNYARLYWAGYRTITTSTPRAPDTSVLIERPGTSFTQTATAESDAQWTTLAPSFNNQYWYQGSANITDLVKQGGAGAYRVSDVTAVLGANNEIGVAGWAVVVFYELEGDTPRNLALFDGLDPVGPTTPLSSTLTGFLVPQSGFKAKLGVLAYEGDTQWDGDQFLFNGTALTDSFNPENNFFNGTYSNLGVKGTNAGDLPYLSGAAGSMGGIDIDVIDVTARVNKGDTQATIGATSTLDRYVLGAFVTSISTYKPDFSTSGKTVRKVTDGALRPGSRLEYTVTVTNTGNDDSINTVVTDQLPPQVEYVNGSLTTATGEFGEYNATTRTITVRVGSGASATQGGTMAPKSTTEIKFQVELTAGATGTIENRAVITADGKLGAPTGTFPTDGNGAEDGVPPTIAVVDNCGTDGECLSASPTTPYCDISVSPQVCVACITSAQCTNPVAPECNLTSHQCECPAGVASCVDTDGDGLTDVTEATIRTNPGDADSDDDGVPDGSEFAPGTDSDGDGLINALDPDSDNDGLFDGTEMGFDCGDADTNPAANRCVPDADLGTTKTNPTLADTDDGGLSDGSEDSNLNGVVDADETDPNLNADDTGMSDRDADGLSDALEATLGSNPDDADSDDDGVLDGLEANPSDDADSDTLIGVLDPDSDNDGLFDGTEMGFGCADAATDTSLARCIADADGGQSRTFPLVADSDRGGKSDGFEDRNHNGRVDSDERNPNDATDDNAECYADAECGTTTSGRVCNASRVCVDGCRGIGGNGCPTDQVCSSGNEVIGTCGPNQGSGGASSTGGASSAGGESSVGGAVSIGGDRTTSSSRSC